MYYYHPSARHHAHYLKESNDSSNESFADYDEESEKSESKSKTPEQKRSSSKSPSPSARGGSQSPAATKAASPPPKEEEVLDKNEPVRVFFFLCVPRAHVLLVCNCT